MMAPLPLTPEAPAPPDADDHDDGNILQQPSDKAAAGTATSQPKRKLCQCKGNRNLVVCIDETSNKFGRKVKVILTL